MYLSLNIVRWDLHAGIVGVRPLRVLRMGKSQAKRVAQGTAEKDLPPSFEWEAKGSTRRRRKGGLSWLLWIVLPLALAAGAAMLMGPGESEMAESHSVGGGSIGSVGAAAKKPAKPPPIDRHNASECMAWAGDGQCKANPSFMLENCAFSCAKLDWAHAAYKKRCPRHESDTPTLAPGQMQRMFARVMSGEYAHLKPEMISEDPPVVLFHDFLSEQEIEVFIRHGQGKYAKSLGVGMTADGVMGDVETEIRTSAHTWCQGACLDEPHVQAVVSRVADLTQTPETNAEYAQLVYYHACDEAAGQKCAFYKRHNDYIAGDEHKLQGVRIYTLFTYLNDVPEGGGTRFMDLPSGEVTFQPQKGKAILWPSVLNDAPHNIDERTNHEALPVTKGEKFGANFWIHQHDFKESYKRGCTAG